MKLAELVEGWSTIDPAVWTAHSTLEAVVDDGELVLPAHPEMTGRSYVRSVAQYDLTDSSLVVELATPPVSSATYAVLTLYTGTDPSSDPALVVEWHGGGMWGQVLRIGYRETSGGLRHWLLQRPYDAGQHRFWRISEAGGTVAWWVSPDAVDWSELAAWPAAVVSPSALRVQLEAWQSADIDEETPPGGDSRWGPLNPPGLVVEGFDPTTFVVTDPYAPNIAIDVLPDVETGTFSIGDPGTPGDGSFIDGDDLLAWGTGSGLWVNVVCDVTRLRVQRGATRQQGILTRTEAGVIELELLDTDRRFDPTVNIGAIHPGIPLRVRLWGVLEGGGTWSEVIGTGRVSGEPGEFAVRYLKSGPPVVTLTAVDVIGRLVRYGSPGIEPAPGAGDNLRSRVERVLAETGTPSSALGNDNDLVYAATLAANPLAEAWQPILDAADAELGRVWVTRYDRLVVRGRGSELSGPVRLTLSDWHGEAVEGTPHCCYTDAQVGVGTELLRNRAVAARESVGEGDEPVVVQLDDPVSQARYTGGVPATVDERNLALQTDSQVAAWAAWVVDHLSEPELRVDSVLVAPWGAPEAWPALAATDVGDRAAFRLHPDIGPTVIRTLGVLGIAHEITPEGWSVTLTTIDAPTPTEGNPEGWFVIGESGDPDDGSELDSGDLLWPVGPVPEFVLPPY